MKPPRRRFEDEFPALERLPSLPVVQAHCLWEAIEYSRAALAELEQQGIRPDLCGQTRTQLTHLSESSVRLIIEAVQARALEQEGPVNPGEGVGR